MVKPNSSKINADSSPWQAEARTGQTICHHCGHVFEIGWDVVKQHHQGCPWLVAYLTDVQESGGAHPPSGPHVLNEEEVLEPDDYAFFAEDE